MSKLILNSFCGMSRTIHEGNNCRQEAKKWLDRIRRVHPDCPVTTLVPNKEWEITDNGNFVGDHCGILHIVSREDDRAAARSHKEIVRQLNVRKHGELTAWKLKREAELEKLRAAAVVGRRWNITRVWGRIGGGARGVYEAGMSFTINEVAGTEVKVTWNDGQADSLPREWFGMDGLGMTPDTTQNAETNP